MNWTTKRQLFSRISKGQVAMDAGSNFATFQNESQQTAIGRFDQVKSSLSELFKMDSGTEISYIENLQAIKSTLAELTTLNKLINLTPEGNDSLEYVSQKLSKLAILQSLQMTMTSTSTSISTQIENRQINLITDNGTLSLDEIYKTNEKVVNQIYLELLENGLGELTDSQVGILVSIAEQCPLAGGNAVFEARGLLGLENERFDFDDNLLCDQSERRLENEMEDRLSNQSFSIYPNPTKDKLELSYELSKVGMTEITIQNRMGQVLLNENLTDKQGYIRFELEALPSGMYFCTVKQKGQILYTEKFVVVK